MAQNRPLIRMGALVLAGALAGASAQSATPVTTPTPTGAAQAGAAQEGAQSPSDSALTAAHAALVSGQLREAQRQYENIIAADYQNADAHFGLGLALYSLGDLAGARFEFQQLIKLAPERYEGYYNLGVVAARARQYDDALANYGKALEAARGKAPASVVAQLLGALATEQQRRRDYAGLTKTYDEALSLTPADDALRLKLADATFRSGSGPDALPLVYAVLRKQPGNVDAALLIAEIYAGQRLPERGLRELDKAIAATAAGGGKAKLLVRKAELLRSGGKASAAATVLRQAIKLDPTNAGASAQLGDLLFARGDRAGALAAWQAAVNGEPRNALYRVNLASVQLAAGALEGARSNATRAQQDAANTTVSARAQFVLGVAAYRLGQFAEARGALQSSSLKAPSAEAYLWLGLSSFALKDYTGAVNALEASVKASPDLGARANLGAALLAAGRYPEAEATLRGVVADAPRNGEAWYNLAWSLRSQAKEQEARQAFKTSLSLGYTRAKGALN